MLSLWLALALSPVSQASATDCPDLSGHYARAADEFGSETKLVARQVACARLDLRYEFPADGTATQLSMLLDGALRTVAEDEFVREQESYRWEGAQVLQELVLTLKYDGNREVRIQTRYARTAEGAFVEAGRDLNGDGEPGEEYELRYDAVTGG